MKEKFFESKIILISFWFSFLHFLLQLMISNLKVPIITKRTVWSPYNTTQLLKIKRFVPRLINQCRERMDEPGSWAINHRLLVGLSNLIKVGNGWDNLLKGFSVSHLGGASFDRFPEMFRSVFQLSEWGCGVKCWFVLVGCLFAR